MRHTAAGAFTAWLALIVLQTVGTAGGSGRVASAFNDANSLVKRALDPNVPAIPDRRAGAVSTTTRTGQLPLADVFDQYSTSRTPTLGYSVPQ